jgi:hypothetical protein
VGLRSIIIINIIIIIIIITIIMILVEIKSRISAAHVALKGIINHHKS